MTNEPQASSTRTAHQLTRAPAGLGFVQDFLNTAYFAPPRGDDPLGTVGRAQRWLDAALSRHHPHPQSSLVRRARVELHADDLAVLRNARAALAAAIADDAQGNEPRPAATVVISLDSDGHAAVDARGSGGAYLVGLLMVEVWIAQQTGNWSRLKICRNERCAVVFYDESRNSSAVWHDAKRCGNAHNLRASRARRRAESTPPPDQSHPDR